MKLTADEEKIFSLLIELANFRDIKREILLSDGQKENDAEHSWHLAIAIILLGKKLEPNANMEKMLKLALVHDLPELYAGDVSVFNESARKLKESHEKEAIEKFRSKLPKELSDELCDLMTEYMECKTIEAKTVQMFDKFDPILIIIANNGISWKKHSKVGIEDLDRVKLPYLSKNIITNRWYKVFRDRIIKEKLTLENEKNI